jgi:hypothetical protein
MQNTPHFLPISMLSSDVPQMEERHQHHCRIYCENQPLARRNATQVAQLFCQDRDNLFHGWLLSSGFLNTATLANRDAGRGAVHNINSG